MGEKIGRLVGFNKDKSMKKYCVYTVIVGGFDDVKQPLVIDDRFDYILFSDTCKESHVGIWQVYKLSRELFKEKETRRLNFLLSRYPKLCTHKFLDDYESSLYVDGNIQITSQYVYDKCVDMSNRGIEWGYIKHQYIDCVYWEMQGIVGVAWAHDYDIYEWYKFLRSENYPEHNGLFENNIIFRKHTGLVAKIEEMWWWGVLNYAPRDQFTLMYAIWKHPQVKTELILTDTENAWHNNGHFLYSDHKPHKRVLKRTPLELTRMRCWRIAHPNEPYLHIIDMGLKHRYPRLFIHLWTFYAIFRYGYKVLQEMINVRLHKTPKNENTVA